VPGVGVQEQGVRPEQQRVVFLRNVEDVARDGKLVFMPFVIQEAIWLSALDFEGK